MNEQLKPFKTVEEIAKKHRLDVSFIERQLKMGEKIEHEHTKNHVLARDIALQHLDEIPDYYTRLKKMEASAKKHHKKFKDVVEDTMHEEERYCPLCNKRETRSECSYGDKAWDKVSIKDQEYSMVRSELKTVMDAARRLQAKVGKGEGNLEAWVQSKITKAADYIDTAADYVASGEMEEQKLVDKLLDEVLEEGKKKGLWANIHAKRKRGERPAKPGEKGYPKTLDIEEDLEQAKKNVGASKCWTGKKLGNPPTKMKGGKEVPNCVAKENVSIEDLNGNTFAEVIDIIKPEPIKGFKSQVAEATRLQAQTGNVIAATLSWRGKYYSLKMFFPQVKTPSRKEINDEIQKVYPGSIVVYHSVSEIQPGQPLIQAFGPQGGSTAKPGSNRNYVKPMGEEVELEEVAAWQRSAGKNKEGGLNEKGRKSYERENPGSDLKAPSKKVGNPRRKSFCARMSGMKKKLTSAKTANDPNSRINKSLRAWNC